MADSSSKFVMKERIKAGPVQSTPSETLRPA